MRGLAGTSMVVIGAGLRADRPSIGASSARRLAAEGARVVVADLSLDAASRTVAAIESDGGIAVSAACDVADEASVVALFEATDAAFGGLDGVHFNAMDMSGETLGVDSQHTVLTLPIEVWNRSLEVGLTGFVLTARAAIPRLLERGGGALVATSSAAAYAGEPIRLGYATAKAGLLAVSRHIASAYGRQGVRCNCVLPGLVPGESGLANMPVPVESLLKMVRSPRLGETDDIAATVAFLLSDDGAWHNGQNFVVDGGGMLGR